MRAIHPGEINCEDCLKPASSPVATADQKLGVCRQAASAADPEGGPYARAGRLRPPFRFGPDVCSAGAFVWRAGRRVSARRR
jgi:hypothetical protein